MHEHVVSFRAASHCESPLLSMPATYLSMAVFDTFARVLTSDGASAAFIRMVVEQATQIGDTEKKTTVVPEHIIQALKQLGFGSYTAEVDACWEQCKADSKGPLLSLTFCIDAGP